MATRSISQSVNFNDKRLTKGFVRALENAQQQHGKDVTLQKRCVDLEKDKVKEFFKGNG